jgi:hypothetical protein
MCPDFKQQHCRTGIHYDPATLGGAVGLCEVPNLRLIDGTLSQGFVCDIRWEGGIADPRTQKPCTNFEDSQFAVSCRPCRIVRVKRRDETMLTEIDSASTMEILARSTTSPRTRLLVLLIVNGQVALSTEL